MADTKPKRRHHINPRFYLRAFHVEGEEGNIWRYDSTAGNALKLSINDAAVERDYYSHVNPEGLRDTEFVENFISDVEGIVAPVFQKVLAREKLSHQERMTFAFFVALSWLRAPATRRQTAEMLGVVIKAIGDVGAATPERFLASYRQMEDYQRTPEKERLSDKEIEETRLFMLGDRYELSIADQMTLLPLVNLQKVAETIFQMKWTIVDAQDDLYFITGDSPVVRDVDPRYRQPMMGPGFRNRFVVVSLPLSPKLCWIASWVKTMPDVLVAPKQMVKLINRSCAIHAEKYLYASTYQDGLLKLAMKYNGPGLQFTASGFEVEGRSIKVGQFKPDSKGIVPRPTARKRNKSGK